MANLSQHAGGGNLYAPAYAVYDGVDDDAFFEVVPDSTNKITASFGFKIGSFTSNQFLIYTKNAQVRFMAVVVPSTDADNPNKVWIRIINSSGTIICQLYSIDSVTDSEWHSLFLAFDGDAGTAIFKIDGADADNVAATGRIAPTTGTLEGSQDLTFANLHDGISPTTGWTAVSLTEVVYDDSYLTNWEDFSSGSSMTQLDRGGWAEFGGNQPQIYSPVGQGWDNLGSVGAPTSGNITEVVIASVPTGLGLDTTATAVAATIRSGETAWVGGEKLIGTGPLLFADNFDGANTSGGIADRVVPYGSGSWEMYPSNGSTYPEILSNELAYQVGTPTSPSWPDVRLVVETGERNVVLEAKVDTGATSNLYGSMGLLACYDSNGHFYVATHRPFDGAMNITKYTGTGSLLVSQTVACNATDIETLRLTVHSGGLEYVALNRTQEVMGLTTHTDTTIIGTKHGLLPRMSGYTLKCFSISCHKVWA